MYASDPSGATKRCTRCAVVKPLGEFYVDGGGVLGRTSQCKGCQRATQRIWHKRIKRAHMVEPPDAAPRECSRCKQVKPAADFSKNLYNPRGFQSACKQCRNRDNKWSGLKARYGLTREQWQAMFDGQSGRCAICADPLQQGRGCHVDHCHATGRVRGLLCEACNLAIGKLKDSAEVLRRAAEYLERSA